MLPLKKLTKKEQEKYDASLRANQKRLEKEKEEVLPPLIIPLSDLPICIIVDIDSTLSRRCDRGIFEFDKSINDDPIHQTIYLLRLIDDANRYQNNVVSRTNIILITGREQRYAQITNEWLNKHQIPFDQLLMRRTGDKRVSNIVKEEIWAGNIRGKYNVLFAIEDREQDIKMYKQKGLYVYQADNR